MKNILIISHTTDLIGPTEHLLSFFKHKNYNVYGVVLPFHYSKLTRKNFIINNKEYFLNFSSKIELLSIFFDSVSILFFILYISIFKRVKFDVSIGVNPLNCFFITFLKKFKILNSKKTILYTIDWIEKRYSSKLPNMTYHFINKYSVKNSDLNWIVSEKIIDEFKKRYGSHNKYVLTPIGCRHKKIIKTLNADSEINLCYVGYFHTDKGIDLLIRNLDKILEINKNFKFYFFGKSPGSQKSAIDKSLTYEEILEKKNIKNKIFVNYFDNIEILDKNLEKMHLGFAIFNADKTTISNYSDPSKVKDYISNNIVTLINTYNPISKIIESEKIGYLIRYDNFDFIKFFENFEYDHYNQIQKNIEHYSYKNSWNSIFENSLRNTL